MCISKKIGIYCILSGLALLSVYLLFQLITTLYVDIAVKMRSFLAHPARQDPRTLSIQTWQKVKATGLTGDLHCLSNWIC